MFRHVVMFQWREEASTADREGALHELQQWAQTASEFGTVQIGSDAGLSPDNFHVVVIGDFPDEQAYQRYAQDPRHLSLVKDVLRPLLAARSAVQYHR